MLQTLADAAITVLAVTYVVGPMILCGVVFFGIWVWSLDS